MEKLMLIDGNSIFYRSFYALPLLKSEYGYSNAVYGFANILIKSIEKLQPTHVAVAFDVSKHTFRNDIYSLYKATRKPMPEELRSQIPVLKEMLNLMGIKYIEKEGIEGDDILGTLAKRFDVQTIIVTGDRDCFQLINETTTICRTLKGVTEVQMMDEKAFVDEFGVKPIQIIDLKALAGDSSDNIPGVMGVGEKSALGLISEYGSVENIYENLDKIPGKLKEKLERDRENAFLSKTLATINCNVDIPCVLSDLAFEFPFDKKVREFFEKYQMRTILRRNDIWKDGAQKEDQLISVETILVQNELQIKELVAKIVKCNSFAFCFNDQKNVIELSDGEKNYQVETDKLTGIKTLFEDNKLEKICFDVKTAMHILKSCDIVLAEPYFDVALARYLLDGITVKDIKSFLFEQGLDDENAVAFSLFKSKSNLTTQMQKMQVFDLYTNLELPLEKVLFDMENTGFKVDREMLEKFKAKYQQESDELQKNIYALVGEFNVNSPIQLAEILYDKLMLPHGKKKSTTVDDLELIRDMHPVVPLVLRYRKVSKFLSTYIYGLEKHIDENGFVHTTFKQTLTGTGRLSSTEPNLQNIPIRGEESKEIRSMFTARESGYVLVDADYSQIELRLLAHLSGEKQLIDAFNDGKDIHTETAVKIFNVPEILVTQDMRRIAKVVNFGVIYGISDFGLASDLGISAKAAKKYISDFFANNPKVEQYMSNLLKEAKETGIVRTILGRIRKMVDITSTNYMVRSRAERAAQNAPLQGSGADIVKIAMVKVFERLRKENLTAKLIMQIHDELIVDCPKAEEQQVRKILKEEMESAYKLLVPLIVDVNSAYRWSESH